MFYGGTAMAALIACLYLCLRKGNAFAADITPPVRLRRWVASFQAIVFLGHVLWFLFYTFSNVTLSASYIVLVVFDNMSLFTSIAGILLATLQDRKRPVWPVFIATIPFAVLLFLYIAYPSGKIIDLAIAYVLLCYVAFTIYIILSVRQYGRWLHDNYADLEHKEIWKTHVLVIIALLLIITDGFNDGKLLIVCYLENSIILALVGLLLWRVETLSQLESTADEQTCSPSASETSHKSGLSTQDKHPLSIPFNIQQLLDERCVGTQLYLQHDLTLSQLAQAVGVNRFYLSQFFSSHGTTYNAYINDLRINHFVCLYREAVATHQPITAQQLAGESGYRSYSTFGLAFKQRMGKTVTAWIREITGQDF